MSEKYIFKNTAERSEYERLQKIEQVFDPVTQSLLRKLGLKRGSVCLEIGPGAGSILRWICREAGPKGSVTAVDSNIRFIADYQTPQLKIHEADIFKMDLPRNHFDIIHARYVLIHNPGPERLIAKLAEALKPGGVLLLEEPDFNQGALPEYHPVYSPAFNCIREAILRMFVSLGLDPALGGKLPAFMEAAGLSDVGAEVWAEEAVGNSVIADFMRLSTLHLKEPYLATGAASETDLSGYIKMTVDASFKVVYYGSHSVWGAKPECKGL